MAIKFNNNSQKAVVFNGVDQKRVIFNDKIIWCKPFTLTITTNTGVSSVTVTRTSSEEPTASINSSLSNGATIYYNDELSISASAEKYFYLNKYDSNKTVTGDTLINITANPQRKPEPPSILNATTEGSPTSRIATFTLKNNNPFSTTISLVIADSSGKTLVQDDLKFNPEESRYLVRQLPNGNYSIKITAYSRNEWDTASSSTTVEVTYPPKVADPIVTNITSDGTSCSCDINNPNSYDIDVYISIEYRDPNYDDTYIEYSGSFTLAAMTSIGKTFIYLSTTKHTDSGLLYVKGKHGNYYDSNLNSYTITTTEETTTTP